MGRSRDPVFQGDGIIRLQCEGPAIGGGALLNLAVGKVGNTEIDEVVDLQRILLGGDLQRLDALIQIAHDRGVVVAGNVELLSLADIVAELIGAGEVFALPR